MNRAETNIAVSLKNVSKTYSLRTGAPKSILEYIKSPFTIGKKQIIHALRDINLDVLKGEVVGIIGDNGSGKSTLLNIILGSIRPDKGGEVKCNGKIIRLALGLGIDKNLSARDNIYLNGSILGLSFKHIGGIFDQIIDFAGIENFVDTPVKFYSKGMVQRLMFSIAMHADADIMLLDEFFGGTGDQDFKEKSNRAFKEKILEGRTIIIVSHSLKTIRNNCHRVVWIEKGKIKAIGPAEEITQAYKNKNI